MTVLMFAGASYYPRKHLQDMLGTLKVMPALDQVAGYAARFFDSDQRFDGLDWITALDIDGLDPQQPLTRRTWKCVHGESAKKLQGAANTITWQDSSGVWHAVHEADEEADDIDPLKAEPLDWPAGY